MAQPKQKKLISIVAGARPNFMKIAPIIRAFEEAREYFDYRLIHTGQHYDEMMNAVFFQEFGIPEPHIVFEGKRGEGDAEQTARILVQFDAECKQLRPDLVMVVGDVNSTLACSIVAKKQGILLAHIESGLRSGDRLMPEEINRIITDSISDLFFVTEPSGVQSLLKEGQPEKSIFYVGHVMVDNLYYQLSKLNSENLSLPISGELKRCFNRYVVVTLHRPSNVESAQSLQNVVNILEDIAKEIPIIFPIHPRTRKNLEKFGIELSNNIHAIDPLPYMEFLNLWKDAAFVLTDSGGLQEETTALSVPCLTMRTNTERPITIDEGTNILVGCDFVKIHHEVRKILGGAIPTGRKPKFWDGFAAQRIVKTLIELMH